MTDTGTARATRADWFVVGLLLLSLTANVWLALRPERPAAAAPRASAKAADHPAKGEHVADFQAEDITGDHQTVTYSADPRPVVLYIFSPSCIWCARNLPNMRTLIKERSGSFRFIAVSLDPNPISVSGYVTRAAFAAPVLLKPAADMISQYGLGSTPKTMIVAPNGIVAHTWSGAYTGSLKTEIEAYFGLKLPGLAEVSPADLEKLNTQDVRAARVATAGTVTR